MIDRYSMDGIVPLLAANGGLCSECLRRKAEDAARPSVITAGGWCAPSASIYGLVDEPGCYIIEPRPFEDFLPQRKKLTRKRALKAFRRWERHNETVGQIAHGYVRPGDLFPEVTVSRGAITFGETGPA